jgi:AcrR family transcriptional regulator
MLNPRTRDFARTRALLIETAGQLFASRGYDRTSVDAIIRQAGVSKGAFYHHFTSKEELLDAVTDFIVEDALQQIGEAVSDRTLGATVRLNRFLNASKVWRLAHFGLWREVAVVLLRDVNAPMLRKIQAQAISRSAPMLAEIIQQGVEEGVFDPPNPLETARLILQLGMASQDAQLLHQLEEMSEGTFVLLEQRAELLVAMLERMLGARPGSIDRLRFADSMRSLNLERADESATVNSGTE